MPPPHRAGARLVRGCLAAALATALAVLAGPAVTAAPSKHGGRSGGSGAAGDAPAKQQPCDVPARYTLDNPLSDTPWTLQRIQPQRAWPLSRGQGVKVAVIDSGVSTTPASLKNAVVAGGHDYLADGNGTCDQFGHGTVIAGIIAGRDGTGAPFYGVAPDAEILPFRVLRDEQHSGSDSVPTNIADAIHRATDAGAKVINLSLTTQDTEAMKSAVRYAIEHDVVLVAAAGNEGGTTAEGSASYPAALPNVLAVGGIDDKGAHVGSSNTANFLDVAAPGKMIDGPAPAGKGFEEFADGGTSFATPFVAGTAALLRAYDPSLTAEQVRKRIIETADHPPQGWNETVGYGVVNPYRALTAVPKPAAAPARHGRQAIDNPQDLRDPMRTVEVVAGILTPVLLVAALLVLIGSRVVPRGRRRAWRSGRATFASDPEPARPARASSASDEKALSITAPSSRAHPPSGPGGNSGGPPAGFGGPPRAIPGRAAPGGGRSLPGSGRAVPGSGRAVPGSGRAVPGSGRALPGGGRR
ncbi:type VII secretion-associated serine protease mycosin [Actinocatenispora thailandica]|uniref:type VII secretion-associated serine protease mycosin n=1 Tax=Actinocatenispora thailandica TaxID=227318 RepID=UPI001EF2A0AE|nr:type VII secretion-associated serine protease mycosin [Actinocatenispora thailandica]